VSSRTHDVALSRRRECNVALTLILVGVVALALIALFFYVVHGIKLGRFRFSASILKLFSVTIEIEADKPENVPANETQATVRRHLEAR